MYYAYIFLCCLAVLTAASNKYHWGTKEERKNIISNAIVEAKISSESKEEKASAFNFDEMPKTSVWLLSKGFKKPSVKALKHNKARLIMEDIVHRAERKLMELKRARDGSSIPKVKAEDLAEELFHRPGSLLTKEEIAMIYPETGCQELNRQPRCNQLFLLHYRTFDGTCNNLRRGRRLFGSAGNPFRRILKAQYEDGISVMRGHRQSMDMGLSALSTGPFGWPTPSARLISKKILVDQHTPSDSSSTQMVMQWGQFIDHDMDLAPEPHATCADCTNTAECEPIRIHPTDPTFSNGRGTTTDGNCLSFKRSTPACLYPVRGKFPQREQINDLTSFIDGSQVYGLSVSASDALRDLNSVDGQMLVGPGNILPGDPFMTGDVRANEQIGLTAMHTLWVREHNRIAAQLKILNPHWSSERTFQEARKIVGALIQKITYYDYLIFVLGPAFDTLIGRYTGYRQVVDATIPNSFSTAAYRYGHSLIQTDFDCYMSDSYEDGENRVVNLLTMFFNRELFLDIGVDGILRGLATQETRHMDEYLSNILTDHLFEVNNTGMDLGALNIQRQRDHGMSSYTVWKGFCEKIYPDLYADAVGIVNDMTLIRLLETYGSLDNVDLWVGGVSEGTLPSAMVGPTFACIFGLTFDNTRAGDRFWYQRRGIFTARQRRAINSVTLSSVICANTGIDEIQHDAFKTGQNRVQCTNIPTLDLSRWEETPCYLRLVAGTNAAGVNVTVYYRSHDGVRTGSTDNNLQDSVPTCAQIECPSSLNDETIIVVPTETVDRNRCVPEVNDRLPEDEANSSARYRGSNFGQNLISGRNGIFRNLAVCLRPDVGRPAITLTCTSTVEEEVQKNDDITDCNSPASTNCELTESELEEEVERLEKMEEPVESTYNKPIKKVDDLKDKDLLMQLEKTLDQLN